MIAFHFLSPQKFYVLPLPQKQTAPRLVELLFLWAELRRLLLVFAQSLEERPSVFCPCFIPVLISFYEPLFHQVKKSSQKRQVNR